MMFYEFNVKWLSGYAEIEGETQPNPYVKDEVTVNLIKLRQIILSRKNNQSPICRFLLVPLYEKISEASSNYKIAGVRLITHQK